MAPCRVKNESQWLFKVLTFSLQCDLAEQTVCACTVVHRNQTQDQHTAGYSWSDTEIANCTNNPPATDCFLPLAPSVTLTWLVSSSLSLSRVVNLKNNLSCAIIHKGIRGLGVRAIARGWNWTWHLLKVEAIGENYDLWNLRAFLSLCTATGWCNLSWWRVARSIREDEQLGGEKMEEAGG